MKQDQFLHASLDPLGAIGRVAYANQPEHMRKYRHGYEHYLNQMPVLKPEDPAFFRKQLLTHDLMQALASDLNNSSWLRAEDEPHENEFNRTILAIGEPDEHLNAHELILARWGNDFTSPVHGHVPGYHHEDILFGKMRVNNYRMSSSHNNIARLVSTVITGPGTFVSEYIKPSRTALPRPSSIHNFTSIGYSASIHYLTEHSRDGRDNGFEVEYFEDYYQLNPLNVIPINTMQGMYLPIGTVALVRSQNVPDYGDHYIVITGGVVQKPHGLRPQEVSIVAPHAGITLDHFVEFSGVRLLQLDKAATRAFLDFHDIRIADNRVIFPSTEPLTVA